MFDFKLFPENPKRSHQIKYLAEHSPRQIQAECVDCGITLDIQPGDARHDSNLDVITCCACGGKAFALKAQPIAPRPDARAC
jgi:hypothetical protein